jgi:hypothetical protein
VTRDKIAPVVVSESERDLLKQAALWAGTSVSATGRRMLLAWARKVYEQTGHADEWPEGDNDDELDA